MKLLFYTDLHAADQTPRSRTGSYKEDILGKLAEIVRLAITHDVDYLLNGADTFDRKSAWRVSHDLTRRMIEILRPFPGDRHLTVIGTHDVPTGRLDKLAQQPLGVLEQAGVITVLNKDGKSEHDFRLTERNQGGDPIAYLHPVPYTYGIDVDPEDDPGGYGSAFNYAYIATTAGPTYQDIPRITMAHGMIMPPGLGFFDHYTPAEKIAAITDATLVLYGHPHTPDGFYTCSHKSGAPVTFCGPGSVARLGSYPYNRNRRPQVVLIEFGPENGSVILPSDLTLLTLETSRLPDAVFADVIQEEMDENTQEAVLSEFASSLAGARISDDTWGIEKLAAEINDMDATPEVKAEAREILEQVAD